MAKLNVGINDLATLYPQIAVEWDYESNGTKNPKMYTAGSGQKVWWKCKYGHAWEAAIYSRTAGRGCPICNKSQSTSFPEQMIYYYIKKNYSDAKNKYKDLFTNSMEIDIYIPSINCGIEYDGAYWHNSKAVVKREKLKYEICQKEGIKLIRIRENGADKSDTEERENCDILINISRKPSEKDLKEALISLSLYIPLEIDININRDRMAILESYYNQNTFLSISPSVAAEWHMEKNGSLKPEMFSYASNYKVWWKCVE